MEFTDTTWTYNFYAVSFDQNRSIHRRNIDTSVRIPDITRHPDKGGYTEHTFPFNHEDMKNIQSHVHPFFATANVYLHMLKLSRKERERMICENEALQLVWKIGQIWLQPVPPSFKDTRKGGANAMADPERDTESFLADKDSQGKIKYQKKEVFYRRLMDWADNQRSMENVFSKRPSPVVPSSPAPLEVSTRRRTRLSTVSLRQQDEDVAVEDTSSVRSAKRKRDDDHLEGPAGKKAAKTDSYPSPPPTRRSTRTGTKSSPTETFNLKPAIASYPTSLVSEVEDGRDLLLDFISSQISILRKSCKNVPKSSIDDQEIADIAFEVFESQSASLDGQMSIDIESDLAPMVKIPVGPPRAAKPKSLPIKKSDSSLSLISPMRPRSSTMTLAHVEIPVALSQSLSLRPAARGSSVAPSAPSSLKPRFERFTRAASTPPVIKRSSSKLLIKSPSVPRIGDIEVKPKPHSTPTNDLKRSSSPTIPLRTPDPGDDSIFLRAGQQMVFASLSKEFGLTVDEVSGVYDELGDLEKTKRVLARLCRSGPSSGLGMISSASQEAPSRVVKSASSPGLFGFQSTLYYSHSIVLEGERQINRVVACVTFGWGLGLGQ
ncbi:hypothetical protein GYMLUDRAFT_393883 [Collybiopsis luxurians FD-317 M1]|uniref:Uncharacterized protein n=1 Tax=Collybiopsis luxurians FD-317 M1 TaxID=944289 RepID=A0A0D0C9N5_9AGAR|nr:hypothetical protein GYMLUDRAFT_393883 [Collybiopsis luxurians FD-317 M1]